MHNKKIILKKFKMAIFSWINCRYLIIRKKFWFYKIGLVWQKYQLSEGKTRLLTMPLQSNIDDNKTVLILQLFKNSECVATQGKRTVVINIVFSSLMPNSPLP